MRRSLFVALFVASAVVACKDNVVTATKTPVPAVHRVPADIEGTILLIDEDPTIESKDPAHLERAKEKNVPHDYRAAAVVAFELAGFKIVGAESKPHDLVARFSLAVREEGGGAMTEPTIQQTYRCKLFDRAGNIVADVPWRWPKEVYVDVYDVFPFATRSLATEVATSKPLLGWLRERRHGGAPPPPAPALASPETDAGS